MLSEGPWMFVGLPNLVRVSFLRMMSSDLILVCYSFFNPFIRLAILLTFLIPFFNPFKVSNFF
ncbi:hypothetical protein Hdeb2414_s0022g00616411 [Helianthus debilis subsp. tardiflorus]